MKLEIKIPALPSIILLLPTLLCSFTHSVEILLLSAAIYGICLLFTKHRWKKAGLFFSVVFITIFGLISYFANDENIYLILLRWLVIIWGTLFFYFQFGYTGTFRLLKALHLPKLLQIAFWSAIRSLELFFPTLNKGLVILRNENVGVFSSPIRFIGSLIILLVNMADRLIAEMEMSLTLRKSDYFSFAQESTEWNFSGIFVVVINVGVSLLFVFSKYFMVLGFSAHKFSFVENF